MKNIQNPMMKKMLLKLSGSAALCLLTGTLLAMIAPPPPQSPNGNGTEGAQITPPGGTIIYPPPPPPQSGGNGGGSGSAGGDNGTDGGHNGDDVIAWDENNAEQHPNYDDPPPPPDDPCDPCENECSSCNQTPGGPNTLYSPFPTGGSPAGRTGAVNKCVKFTIDFGRFPSNPGVNPGKLLIESKAMNPMLYTSAIVGYDHPVTRKIISVKTLGTRLSEAMMSINGQYQVRFRFDDSFTGRPVGESSAWKSTLSAHVAVSEQNHTIEVLSFEETTASDERITYDGKTGEVTAFKPKNGPWLELLKNTDFEIVRNAVGTLEQVFNTADGLLNIAVISDSSFRIDWYKRADVGGKDSETQRYVFRGSPLKSWVISNPSPNAKSNKQFHVAETRGSTMRFEYLWTYYDQLGDWMLRKGIGDEATEEYKQTIQNDNIREEIMTLRMASGAVASKNKKVYTKYSYGELLTSEVEDVGGANRTTAYAYDDKANLVKITYPTGRVVNRTYDAARRLLSETSSGAYGSEETVYDYTGDETRPAQRVVKRGGAVVSSTTYTYEEDVHDKIVSKPPLPGETEGESGSLGQTVLSNTVISVEKVNGVSRTTLTEYNSSSTPYYMAGRIKRTVLPDGSQMSYEYESLGRDGVRSTSTLTANGEIVPNRSTRTVQETDVAGNVVKLENYVHNGQEFVLTTGETRLYSPSQQMTERRFSDGRVSKAEWICKGPTKVVDIDGIETEYFYDSAKRLYKTVRHSPNGDFTTTQKLDAAGRIVEKTVSCGGLSQTVKTEYDKLGRVTKQTDALGLVTTYAYSANGLVTTVTDPAGATRVTTLNNDYSIASLTGTGVVPQYYAYAMDGALQKTTVFTGTPNSPRKQSSWTNGFGETVKTEQSAFNGASLITTNTYNDKGQLTSSQTAGQPAQNFEYDALGNMIKFREITAEAERFMLRVVSYENIEGSLFEVTNQTVSSSDASIPALTTSTKKQLTGLSNTLRARLISVDVRGNSSEMRTTFAPALKIIEIQTKYPFSSEVYIQKSIDGRKFEQTSPNSKMRFTYNGLGQILTQTDGRNNTTTISYNTNGLKNRVIDATGAITEYFYDDTTGRLMAIKDALGQFTRYVYNTKGQKIGEFGDNTYPLRFEYNEYGEMTKHYTYRSPNAVITEEPGINGDVTAYIYDSASGLLKEKVFADGNKTTYTYDVNGNLSTRTSARGVMTTYTCDAFGQLLKTTYSDGTPTITNIYNALGQLVRVYDSKGTTTFSYNQYSQKISETINGVYNKVLTSTYDNFGRELNYGIDGDVKQTLTYDNAGRVSSMNNQFTWNYMENSNLKSSVNYPGSIEISYEYEENRDVLTQVKNSRSGIILSQYDYRNDLVEQRINIGKSGTMMSANDIIYYSYNSRSEVIASNSRNTISYKHAYSYDNIGNRISALENTTNKNYTTNALNQYTSNTGFSPMYDLDGNQTKIKTSTGIWDVTYNGENRPIKFISGNKRIEMKYDYMGRRVWMAYWVNNAVEKERKFMYNDYTLVQEMKWDNSVLKEYVWDPTEDIATKPLLMSLPQKGLTLLYTHDGNKNVSEVAFFASANGIGAHYEYSPFGATTVSSKNTRITDIDIRSENPFRFSSEYHDDELDLIYYNYRYYNPQEGRWLSREPLGESTEYNLYNMCENNSIDYFDDSGLKKQKVVKVGGMRVITDNASDARRIVSEFEKIRKGYPYQIPVCSSSGSSLANSGDALSLCVNARSALVLFFGTGKALGDCRKQAQSDFGIDTSLPNISDKCTKRRPMCCFMRRFFTRDSNSLQKVYIKVKGMLVDGPCGSQTVLSETFNLDFEDEKIDMMFVEKITCSKEKK